LRAGRASSDQLSQTRDGWAAGSRFVFSQHCRTLRSLGVPEGKIAAVPHWSVAACFTERERAVLAYAVMSRALRTGFDDRGEPVTEAAAPEGQAARDIGTDISLPK
jgi:alkylhydroperoxidase family enzyme